MTGDKKKNSVLVVDDDTANLMQLIHILQPDYTIFTAKNGPAALEIAAKSTPDLILLDIIMPDMNGFEVLTELRKSKKTSEIPIIFITGMDDNANESEGLSLGAVDYIRKPFFDMVVKLRVRHQLEIINLKRNLKRTAEVAETANRAKSSFLASMSHEIRTPMNAIIGMLELLTHESLNSRQMNYVKDINHSATSLLTIINDILDMSKIESGKMELVPIDFDFFAFLDNIHSMFTYVSEEKGLKFIFEIDDDLPRYLYGDDIRLRQVLINICGNAVKFTEKGQVRLKTMKSGKNIIFEIADTGIGIKNDDIRKLFNAFEQTDLNKTRKMAGTGLGLAITKSFVNLKGGTVAVESEYGKGSIFTVTIPLIEGDGEKAETSVSPSDRKLFSPKAKILVVDDNEFNLKVAVGLLNLSGIKAKTAASGLEAIDMVQEIDYDIIFMDHMMPGMDGVETTIAIRKIGGDFKQPVIVALTANAVHGVRDFFLENEFNDFVPKPIDVRELASVLERWLPKELLEKTKNISNEPDVDEDDFIVILNGIDDININIGLNNAAGVESLYYQSVELCCKQLPSESAKMSESLINDDIKAFAISVHTIKSILATIGAVELSNTAAHLEELAKDGDSTACKELFPDFHDKIMKLHSQIAAIFKTETSKTKTPGDFATLKENVEKAIAATKSFNDSGSLAALKPLLQYDFGDETNTLLENAIAEISNFDYEKAEEILNEIKY
ncbi:MAG: response regulator [Oscillospiraceae bacterium]|jgi:signal transduction histidine kinase/HPt (histidine-containing phosphotransfer) domain-containing protein|nr:response regulator [Oscillospiraceae bacterium]